MKKQILIVMMLVSVLTVTGRTNPENDDYGTARYGNVHNMDRIRMRVSAKLYRAAEEQFAGYQNEKLRPRDFPNRKAFRAYRLLRDQLQGTRQVFREDSIAAEKTELAIEAFQHCFPDQFAQVASLVYLDKFNVAHPLSIFIGTGFLSPGMEEAQTGFNLTGNDEVYCLDARGNVMAHAVRITLGIYAKKNDILAHEFGHVMGLAAAPRKYFMALSSLECEYNCQENSRDFIAAPAMQMQRLVAARRH